MQTDDLECQIYLLVTVLILQHKGAAESGIVKQWANYCSGIQKSENEQITLCDFLRYYS